MSMYLRILSRLKRRTRHLSSKPVELQPESPACISHHMRPLCSVRQEQKQHLYPAMHSRLLPSMILGLGQ